MDAIELMPVATGAFTSDGYELERDMVPATLIKKGLAMTETIKVEVSIDNGATFFQLVDGTGDVGFAATGKNFIILESPMLFRLVKASAAAAAGASLFLRTNV